MNSGHMKTEDFCNGFFESCALIITSGITSSGNLDTSFFVQLGLAGYIAASGCGMVTGTVTDIASSFQAVVGPKNNAAQYWDQASSGSYTVSGVKPGTYTSTLFKKELEIGTPTDTVSTGKTAMLNMKSSKCIKSTIWQIRIPSSTSFGFWNANTMCSEYA